MACAQEAAQEVLHDVGKIEDPLLRQKVPLWVATGVVVAAVVLGVVVAGGGGGGGGSCVSKPCHPRIHVWQALSGCRCHRLPKITRG